MRGGRNKEKKVEEEEEEVYESGGKRKKVEEGGDSGYKNSLRFLLNNWFSRRHSCLGEHVCVYVVVFVFVCFSKDFIESL